MNEPVFIGGFRSGSTLLINLLGLHSEIAPWFETKELCEALRWLRVVHHPAVAAFETTLIQPRAPAGFHLDAVVARMRWHVVQTCRRLSGEAASGKAGHETYPLGADWILYSQQEALAAIACWHRAVARSAQVWNATGDWIRFLGQLQVERMGRRLWVNKTPEIPRFNPELWRSLGPCRQILLIRNGWEVVRSAVALGWGDVERLAWQWRKLIEESRRGARPGYYLEVRYEHLVADPKATLDRIWAFLGLESQSDNVLRRYQEKGARIVPPACREPHDDLAARYAFDRVAAGLMASLGYE